MRVYRYLILRLVHGLGLILAFTLLCFSLWVLFEMTIGPPKLITGPIPDPFSLDPWYSLRYDDVVTVYDIMGHFVFYISHMMTGEYGASYSEGFRSVGWCIGNRLVFSLRLCLIPLLFVVLVWTVRTAIRRVQRVRKRGYFSPGEVVRIIFVAGLIPVTGVLITQSVSFFRIHGVSTSNKFWLASFIVLFVVMRGGLSIVKTECNDYQSETPVQEQSTRRRQIITEEVSSFGIRVALVWTMILSSLILIETALHSYGFGRCIVEAAFIRNGLMLNAVFFLMGLSVILMLVGSEVCYGLWRFGAFSF